MHVSEHPPGACLQISDSLDQVVPEVVHSPAHYMLVFCDVLALGKATFGAPRKYSKIGGAEILCG